MASKLFLLSLDERELTSRIVTRRMFFLITIKLGHFGKK
jgi:hypothetical protein